MTAPPLTDSQHLARAIELAEGGRGRTSPNPLVGAVVVKDGAVLGEGFHRGLGEAHAERDALAACGDVDTLGATLYVSLEPCCHTGRTPPCTEAIVEAGISRVVVASHDPSEHASGRGLGILRDEGIDVVGADVIVATGENEPARVRSALDQLGSKEITSVLLEGGPHLAGAFLDAGEIDEIRLFLAPLVLGGRSSRATLEGEGAE